MDTSDKSHQGPVMIGVDTGSEVKTTLYGHWVSGVLVITKVMQEKIYDRCT